MAGIPRWLLTQAGQDITVEAREGSGAYGDVYAAPVTVRALVEQSRRLVRDTDGAEVTSETTVRVPLSTTAPAGSRITLPDGRRSLVITTSAHNGGRLPVPSHLEINLT